MRPVLASVPLSLHPAEAEPLLTEMHVLAAAAADEFVGRRFAA